MMWHILAILLAVLLMHTSLLGCLLIVRQIQFLYRRKIVKVKESEKSVPSDPAVIDDKASYVLTKWLEILEETPLNQLELILASSNLLFCIGASIEGYKEVAPSPTEIMKLYYAFPGKVGIALMAQALQMNSEWGDALTKMMEDEKKKLT